MQQMGLGGAMIPQQIALLAPEVDQLPTPYGVDGIMPDQTFYSDSMAAESRYAYLMELISNIEDVSIGIANKCDAMLKEFVVDEKYMIPGVDYLEMHKTKYPHDTFRPLSLISAFTSLQPDLAPLHNIYSTRDSSEFKLQYGGKGILYSDNMKFLNEKYITPMLCAMNDAGANSVVKIDNSNYIHFIRNYLTLFRFNFSVLNYF